MAENSEELRSLALTPTWSVAAVLTIFIAVSLFVERSIHRLSNWLKKTNRNPLFHALEKMKEELMLLGFISLLLTASSTIISNICIDSKFYNSKFSPCTKTETEDSKTGELGPTGGSKRLLRLALQHPFKRTMSELKTDTCAQGHEPFVSYEGLEQLHRFIFVMAITHVSYSCLTMLLTIVKIHTWRRWEDEAHRDRYDSYAEITKALTMRRQSMFMKFHMSNPLSRNCFLVWVTCFFRQFGKSVVRADYLTLRRGFIMNHNLTSIYDFHSYMIRSMEEEFQMIVGVRFAGQFLCSYSTLPLYALVTQMGSNYKAALIPRRIRETMHGWGKEARRRRRRRRHRHFMDDATTVRTETSTVCSLEEGDQDLFDGHHDHSGNPYVLVDLQPTTTTTTTCTTTTIAIDVDPTLGNSDSYYTSTTQTAPLLHSVSVPSSPSSSERGSRVSRSISMPISVPSAR